MQDAFEPKGKREKNTETYRLQRLCPRAAGALCRCGLAARDVRVVGGVLGHVGWLYGLMDVFELMRDLVDRHGKGAIEDATKKSSWLCGFEC